jgi:hypothetical protein
MASANRPDRGQSEVRNGETEAGQDAPTNISLQRTEQQRDRPTNVSPKGSAGGGKYGSQSRVYSGNRHERKESERLKGFTYEELTKRDP